MNLLKSIYNSPFKELYSHPIHTCFPIIASNINFVIHSAKRLPFNKRGITILLYVWATMCECITRFHVDKQLKLQCLIPAVFNVWNNQINEPLSSSPVQIAGGLFHSSSTLNQSHCNVIPLSITCQIQHMKETKSLLIYLQVLFITVRLLQFN